MSLRQAAGVEVLISHRNKFVFIHIAKNAGMHVCRCLKSQVGFNGVIIDGPHARVPGNPVYAWQLNRRRKAVGFEEMQSNARNEVALLKKHSFSSEIRAAMPREYPSYRRFCVVRNPFDRAVSQYHYILGFSGIMNNKRLQRAFEGIKAMSGFKQYVQEALSDLVGHNFFAPQWRYIEGDDKVDIIAFENIDAELSSWIYRNHLQAAAECFVGGGAVNASQRSSDYRDYYDKETISLVSRIYAADLERFGYGF